ncbi:S-adenosyl-L-methionine-dependent methyltransferase [Streptomyces nigrescens]|uniref:S-adenosyl-L-methionine-dependent methyltransferase n=2 Tax=Streptomyces TaxID=1883 RepID=A0ABM7ZMP1_STRNI|nr:SAM-dependent methyltransferase [Streptomyces nigrescens]MEE4421843.1 SAM-dependent methyltransferase [Streptomyces sp. DSM 41528]BDM67680.1 S-adenosyl-L-methionine-dependent methyltransferase [Streptomyces nigrescens]
MGELRGVAATALGVARIRATESARPDRLFDDPYAAGFVAAAPPRPAAAARTDDAEVPAPQREAFYRGLFRHVVLRTRFFDDYLTTATTQHALRQVVILAAGLDTRAHRLPWPDGVRLYEVDLPEVLAFKERVLAEQGARPRCARTAVAADLRTDWTAPLRAAGFAPDEPTAWLVEGLLVYLSAGEAARLLTTLGEQSAPGSRLAFPGSEDFRTSAMMADGRTLPSMREISALWKGGLDEPAADWLGRHGWQPRIHARETVAASYGRVLGDRPDGAGTDGTDGRGAFVVAVRGRDEVPSV